MNLRSRILGCGGYLPARVLTNDDMASFVETNDTWIRERTGITQRHVAAEGELTSDLATHAAKEALQKAGLTPQSVDLIIVATTTPDDTFPATAVAVQHKLEAYQAFAFDVQAVCAGFMYALSVADGLLRSGQAKTALVIGAETMSRILNWSDRKTCILFGDGAGAIVLQAEKDEGRGILSTHLYADGRHRNILYVDGGAGRTKQVGVIHMSGAEVMRHAINKMGQSILKALEVNNLKAADINWFVPHQANQRIIEGLAHRFDLPLEKIILCVDRHANTSAASIPLALKEGENKFKKNDLLILSAIGGGLTWGSAAIRW